jgi:hypothetical protein
MLPRTHRTGTALAVTAAVLLAPGAAHGAQPKPGYYAGEGVDFKIAKFGTRPQLFRLSLSETLTCADGTTRADALDTILISGPKVSRAGRFKYAAPGVVFKGRFTSRSQASGTLSRTDGECSASLAWAASRKSGGEPLPQG